MRCRASASSCEQGRPLVALESHDGFLRQHPILGELLDLGTIVRDVFDARDEGNDDSERRAFGSVCIPEATFRLDVGALDRKSTRLNSSH